MNLNLLMIAFLCCLMTLNCHGQPLKKVEKNVVHTVADDHHNAGTWKKQLTWKSRWVKTYKPKTVYVGHWKRVWTPAWVSEFVPKHSIPWKHTNAVVHHY